MTEASSWTAGSSGEAVGGAASGVLAAAGGGGDGCSGLAADGGGAEGVAACASARLAMPPIAIAQAKNKFEVRIQVLSSPGTLTSQSRVSPCMANGWSWDSPSLHTPETRSPRAAGGSRSPAAVSWLTCPNPSDPVASPTAPTVPRPRRPAPRVGPASTN